MAYGNTTSLKRARRHKRIRAKVAGTKTRPRLSVYKSNRYLYGQLIDDERHATLLSVRSTNGRLESSREAGARLAQKAAEQEIKAVVFDRGGFSYLGAIKAFADGAREGGLEF